MQPLHSSSPYQLFASLLSADFSRLGEECKAVLEAGANGIHFDVMDNHYVPNLTMGPIGCEALRKAGITAPIDIHLMTKPVDDLIVTFAKAGASSITIHPEATEHLDRSLHLIQDQGCQAGLAINPGTPLSYLDHVLHRLNLILVMSVNPGFPGQDFIASALSKIHSIKALINKNHAHIPVMVDGGIKIENIRNIAKAGACQFVIGSALFSSENYADMLARFREQLNF